jgi:hypothetical protein
MVYAKGNAEDIQTVSRLTNLTIEQVKVSISKYYMGISGMKVITSPSNAWPTSGSSTRAVHIY